MFRKRYDRSDLSRILIPARHYRPFPTADEREAWEAVAAEVRQGAVSAGEALLGRQWPALPATLYLDYARTGDRARYEGPYFRRRSALGSLVMAECMEGRNRFLDDIINGLWAICEESGWVIPAHNGHAGMPNAADPIVDLFAAETGALLAWTHYLLRSRLDAVDDRVSARMRREVKTRILDPFLKRTDFWWMGSGRRRRLNNWSPWCCSTCLAAALLLEGNARRRGDAVAKMMMILDRFLAGYLPDGGCDEGPSYWTVAGGAMFDCLELLHTASQGKINLFENPLIKEMGRYIYRAHISGDYYLDFADCRGKLHIPAGLVYRYGRRTGDEKMAALGSWAYHQEGSQALVGDRLLRALPNVFDSKGIEEPADPPYVRDVWLDGTQVMAAREQEGSDRGLYLAAKGGHNEESHNHNDVGQFMVYADGQPVLIDVGVGTYTAKTFSDQRYEIWTMQSAYHNLPTVNGVQQQEGEEFRASGVSYHNDDGAAEFRLNIARAYPKASGIKSWQRTCRLVRGGAARVEIAEEFALKSPSRDITLSLMTLCSPRVRGPGGIELTAGKQRLRLLFDAGLTADVETIPLDDPSLESAWGAQLYRVLLRPKKALAQGKWVLRIARA